MPYKLKTSARKSRRNKKIGIAVGVALLALIIVFGGLYAIGYFAAPTPDYSLLVSVNGSGSTNSTGTQPYKSGTSVGVQASATEGWVLDKWLENGVDAGSTNPLAVTVSRDINLTAVFKQLPSQDKVLLETSMGNITIMLRDDKPNTAGNFKNLVLEGMYDNTTFHRVISGFMIQGGDTGTSVASIADEIGSNNTNTLGTIAMANTGAPNSASSQFFINTVDNSGTNRYAGFDTSYTVFGYVIDGMDVAQAISHVPTDSNDKPVTDVVLIKAILLSA